jgi:predicted ATPase
MPLLRAQARVFLGSALAEEGDLDEGIRLMREGIAGIIGTGADMGMANYLCMLAQACGRSGEVDEAVAIIDRGLDNLTKLDSTYQLPELLRTKGELLSKLDPSDEAIEDCFRRSLTVARGQGTKMSELRTALRLAHRYAVSGRENGARDILAPIHASFSEGFSTPDLVEASNLLRGLAHRGEAV